jgi:spore coat protein CotH
MLLKPERIQGLPYLGESWAAYQDRYNPKREPTDAQKKRLIEFTKLVNRADDAAFAKKIGDYLDVDEFLRFMAANSLVANVDSFFGTGHNYFLYLNPRTDRFHFIPWDLDLSLGNFVFASAQDQLEWSIAQPYLGKNRLAERILAVEEHNKTYRDNLRLLTEKVFTPKVMNVLIADMEKTVRDAKDPKFATPFAFPGAPKTDLRQFVAERSESVIAQLDGKSDGKQLTMNFFFGAPGKGPPGKGPGFGKGK